MFNNKLSWDLMPGTSMTKNYGDSQTVAWGFTYSTRLAWYPFDPRWSLVGEMFGTAGENKAIPEYRIGIRWEPSQYAVLAVTYGHEFNGSEGAGFEVGLMIFTPRFACFGGCDKQKKEKEEINKYGSMKQDTDTSFSRPLVIKNRQYDIGRFFSSMPAIVLFALIVVCYALVVALGVIIGYQKFLGNIKVADSPIETAVAAVFGLLAFMLAFTFSLTWSRFANRNVLVIAQAQAIGTCYLRTSLITEKQKNEVRMLLYEYTNILVRLPGHADLHKSLDRLDEIHLLIWKQTATLGKEDIDSELRSLFISSVNELISIPVQKKLWP